MEKRFLCEKTGEVICNVHIILLFHIRKRLSWVSATALSNADTCGIYTLRPRIQK